VEVGAVVAVGTGVEVSVGVCVRVGSGVKVEVAVGGMKPVGETVGVGVIVGSADGGKLEVGIGAAALGEGVGVAVPARGARRMAITPAQ
jgi:hypothetical protein